NLRAAGLSEVIDLRVGDAFETLKSGLGGGIDLLLLDGWKEAYLPMLRFLEPQLSPNALVVADDLDIAPEALAPYLDYVRKPGNGYVSVEMVIASSYRCAAEPSGYPRGSLHLEIELAHQRSPLRLLGVDVLGILFGRRGHGVAAFGEDALLDLLGVHQGAQGS